MRGVRRQLFFGFVSEMNEIASTAAPRACSQAERKAKSTKMGWLAHVVRASPFTCLGTCACSSACLVKCVLVRALNQPQRGMTSPSAVNKRSRDQRKRSTSAVGTSGNIQQARSGLNSDRERELLLDGFESRPSLVPRHFSATWSIENDLEVALELGFSTRRAHDNAVTRFGFNQ